MRYRPGKWAMASTAIAALGWFINIWWAYEDGVDTAPIGLISFIFIPLLGFLPMLCGIMVFITSRKSQRIADAAFSACMIAQGLALVIGPQVANSAK